MRKLGNRRGGTVLGGQRIEYLVERIDDGLTQRVGALGNFGVVVVACSRGKIFALLGYNGDQTLDCPCAKSLQFAIVAVSIVYPFQICFRCGR